MLSGLGGMVAQGTLRNMSYIMSVGANFIDVGTYALHERTLITTLSVWSCITMCNHMQFVCTKKLHGP